MPAPNFLVFGANSPDSWPGQFSLLRALFFPQDATDEVIGEVELLLKEAAELKEKGVSRPPFGGEAIAAATALTVSLQPTWSRSFPTHACVPPLGRSHNAALH